MTASFKGQRIVYRGRSSWGDPTPRRSTCKRSGCSNPATIPDLESPAGDQGWCVDHLRDIRAVREVMQAELHRSERRWMSVHPDQKKQHR